jgi:phosphate transport system substrate-binding protein
VRRGREGLIKGIWRGAAVSAALAFSSVAGLAQDVTLLSLDGTLEISGSFQGYDGELYRVLTPYGLLTIDGQGVTCDGPACPDLTAFVAEVRVVGEAEAGRRVLAPLLAAFAAERGYGLAEDGTTLTAPDSGRVLARFDWQVRGPQAAALALRRGVADLALASLAEPDLAAHPLGTQALVAVVSPDNPLPALPTADLARALSGQVRNWAELGGPDMPLVVHATAPGSGFRRALEARLGHAVVAVEQHGTLADLDTAVARDPWALAVTQATSVAGARVLALTDSCGLMLQPTRMAVKAQDYPLVQPFFLMAAKRRLPLIARDFIAFSTSPGAQAAIAEAGLIDRGVVRSDLLGDGLRLANAIRAAGDDLPLAELQRLTTAMQGAERLSLTFRFDGAAGQLDAVSEANLAELVRLIEVGSFGDRTLIFAGFSDGQGDAARNRELSQARATALRDRVAKAVPDLAALGVTLAADAFGEALPMACDESPTGRQLNRRVELWLRPVTGSAAPEN